MSTSLPSLFDSLSEKLRSDKCKDCKSELDYLSLEDSQLIFECFECKRNYMKDFNKDLQIQKFCNGDINKFLLLQRKRVYSYEYMDS